MAEENEVPDNPWRKLYDALHARGGYEIVNETVREGSLRLSGRVKPLSRVPQWLEVVQALYLAGEASSDWDVDLSKQYFVREELRFAWRVILQGEGIESRVDDIVNIVLSAPSTRTGQAQSASNAVWSVPLVGAGQDRNNADTSRGKGAQPMLKAAIGRTRKERMGL